ncbi:MAG: protein-disulfide isomerase [Sphingomonadales bacterium]|nr:MAG: protein-disulfide isomerase [Sphingomonadales bacterium]
MATPAAAQKRPVAKAKTVAKPAPTRWVNVVVRTPEGGVRQGNPNAKVKLVEYGARTCPSCARFAEEAMPPLRAKYIASGKVSYEFRDFLIHGAPDMIAAVVNQCMANERFFPVLDAMFAAQTAASGRLKALEQDKARRDAILSLPENQIAGAYAEALGWLEFSKQQGLPDAKARVCLADEKLLIAINKTSQDGEKLGVHGTPSFLINDQLVEPHDWGALEPLLIAAIG